MKALTDIMSRLRSAEGCPWDREQSLESLKQHLIEECYELVDAIDSGDVERHKDELGDILLQVLFQSQIRKEEGSFAFDDVAKGLAEKLIRRHPHVFGDAKADTPAEVLQRWEKIKAGERKEKKSFAFGMLDGVPRSLPALMKAQRVQGRAARVGFDWTDVNDVIAKIEEELAEVKEAVAIGNEDEVRGEIGDLLFAVVNLSRFRGMNAEEALEETVVRFGRRFAEMERRIGQSGRALSDCSLSDMEVEWQAAKLAT